MPFRRGDAKRLEGQRGVVSTKYKTKEVEIERVWIHKGIWILKFKGVDTIKEAWRLRDGYLEVEEDVLPEEETPIGWDIYTQSGEWLGKVVQLIPTPANDVLLTDKDALVPFVEEWVISLHPEERKMIVKELKEI